MHDILIQAVFSLSDSLRQHSLELDTTGDGEIEVNDHTKFLKLLQRELPEVTLTPKEVGALASVFEGDSGPGSLVVDQFIYACEETAFLTLQSQDKSRQELTYENYVAAGQRAEAGREQGHTRVMHAPSNTPASQLLRAIQRKLRTRSSSGVSTENRLFLDMDTSRTGHVSMQEMLQWFAAHGLRMSLDQLGGVLDLVAESTSARGRHAFTWSGQGRADATIDYRGFDNLIAGLILPTGSTGKLFAPAPWERADRHAAATASSRALQRFQANARVRAREALASACSALAHEAWNDTELLLALSRKLESSNTSLMDAFKKADTDGSGLVSVSELSVALSGLNLGITLERATSLIQAFDRTGNGKVACFEFIRMVNSTFSADASSPPSAVDVAALSIDGGSMSRSESKADDVRQLARSDSKALDYVDYTNAPPASEESLATTDRETLIAFRDKLENERMKMRSVFQKFDKDSSKTISPTELSQGLASLGIDLDDGQANRLCKRFDIEGDGRLHYFEFVKIFHGLPPACAW